jgi:hypothetical protein
VTDEREHWKLHKSDLKRIRKAVIPYLRKSRERDLLGLNFANIEAMADLIEDMADEIERLRKP